MGKVEPLVIRSQPLAYAAQRRLLHYSLLVSTSATSLPPEPPLYVLVGVHHSMERFSPGATPPTILQPIRRCAQQYNCQCCTSTRTNTTGGLIAMHLCLGTADDHRDGLHPYFHSFLFVVSTHCGTGSSMGVPELCRFLQSFCFPEFESKIIWDTSFV